MATILLVNGPSVDRDRLMIVLSGLHHVVIQATDGIKAVKLAKTNRPDLVITDVIFASMDGYQLVRQIRSIDKCQDVRFLFYTANRDIAEKLGRACDVSFFLDKPCDPRSASEAVGAALNQSAAAKEKCHTHGPNISIPADSTPDRAHALVDIGVLIGSATDPVRLVEEFCEIIKSMFAATYVGIEACITETQPHHGLSLRYADDESIALGRTQLIGQAVAASSHRVNGTAGESKAIEFPLPKSTHKTFHAALATERHVYGWLRMTGTSSLTMQDRELISLLAKLVGAKYEEILERASPENDSAHTVGIELENWLTHRTDELEAENKDLRAFSYSVSHDLRSPLQSIVGFTQILVADCGGKMDRQGRACVEHIQSAARRMAELIDDLLSASAHLGDELVRECVDLSSLAQNIAGELRRREPAREVEFAIGKDLVVEGHPGLLLEVLENLLGNAWKFTSRQPRARIELGSLRQDETVVFFVRDNGVGFNMCSSKGLFNDFRRLHSQSEFAGTGVGLANVKRVIQRHKGRVWAQAEVGKGATFFFTVQPPFRQ